MEANDKRWMLYQALAIGIILFLIPMEKLWFCVLRYAVVAFAATGLKNASRYYFFGGVSAAVGGFCVLLCPLTDGFIFAQKALLLPMGCFLLLGVLEQKKRAGEPAQAELASIILWVVFVCCNLLSIGVLLLNNESLSLPHLFVKCAEMLGKAAIIVLIIHIFRGQREYIQNGGINK